MDQQAPMAASAALIGGRLERRRYGVGQRRGAPRFQVDPDDLRGPVRVVSPILRYLVVAPYAGAAGFTEPHLYFYVPWVHESNVEIAASIDNHRTMTGYTLRARHQCNEPFDARLLHEPEIDDVVDVTKRIHVGPAHLLERRVDENTS